jgi:hypothetical protein
MTGPKQYVDLPARQYTAPMTVRGYVVFLNIRPGVVRPQFWVCDECCERVTTAHQREHARKHR